ncbi:MAG: alpha-glucan family phosphorylase [Rhodothermia bacterium]|nr:alpha-glucan family phosphorylase [Rhodothermia bacterium]
MTTRQKLKQIAANLWWSWQPDAIDLFRQLNPDVFGATDNNPLRAVKHSRSEVLSDTEFNRKVDAVYTRLQAYLSTDGELAAAPRIAYFCMEYGLHESLPLYSGGLGILAGDHTKAASDLGVPLTAVGLFLREGYFKQYFNEKGQQQADYPAKPVTSLPIELAENDSGDPITVTVHLGHQPIVLRAWILSVGRSRLVLLDCDIDPNPFQYRYLTRRLYAGDTRTRIRQEILLGIGGLRMLRALGEEPERYHMNEGHCAFVGLELMRERLATGQSRDEAEQWVRDHCIFTTHTPVKAGHDRFDSDLFLDQMSHYRSELAMSDGDLLSYGRANPADVSEPFTMTILGLRLASITNGVSRLNGEVARAQWHHLFPEKPVEQVPIGHVTNGVHLPTWTSPLARPFLDSRLPGWLEDPDAWLNVDQIPDNELWEYRRQLRKALIEFAQERGRKQTLPQNPSLDPDVLTIGFARRFATYKRAPLFFHDMQRAIEFFASEDRPLQMIYAGKAHPADSSGKEFIRHIYELTQHPALHGRLVFLENYDMEIGRMLVSGADVWLNNPRRPYEASGTSGQKVAVHGGLNFSILDGWWPEGFDGTNGWSIGMDSSAAYMDPAVQDDQDAGFIYDTLETSILPAFYDRNGGQIPEGWITMMRSAMRKLPYQFSARRMVRDYAVNYYMVEALPTGG